MQGLSYSWLLVKFYGGFAHLMSLGGVNYVRTLGIAKHNLCLTIIYSKIFTNLLQHSIFHTYFSALLPCIPCSQRFVVQFIILKTKCSVKDAFGFG